MPSIKVSRAYEGGRVLIALSILGTLRPHCNRSRSSSCSDLLACGRLKAWRWNPIFYLQELFCKVTSRAKKVSSGSSSTAHARHDHALVARPGTLLSSFATIHRPLVYRKSSTGRQAEGRVLLLSRRELVSKMALNPSEYLE